MEISASTHLVELDSLLHGKITQVSLYIGLAEVTRSFLVDVTEGDNKVVISNLPQVLVDESLRIEGNRACVIYDVSISAIPTEKPKATSERLTRLQREKERVDKALLRCNRSIEAVDALRDSLHPKHVQPGQLSVFGKDITDVAGDLDEKLIELEEEETELEAAILEEKSLLGSVPTNTALNKRVSININAVKAEKLTLLLIYGVSQASWKAAYDVYAKMETKEKPVNLVYKAAITQTTGEDWNDVSLTLETVRPTFGLKIPELDPWTLSLNRPFIGKVQPKFKEMEKKKKKKASTRPTGHFGARETASSDSSECEDEEGSSFQMPTRATVANQGAVSATFSVPGFISVPSDDTARHVTIVQLNLDAVMSWVSVPKKVAKAHLTSEITNDSEYSLLEGIASVYVDGSFISRTQIPLVSPQESFDCPLGIDPTVRIIYHPVTKKSSRFGFPTKMKRSEFQQRITITNTKPTSTLSIKVFDQIPVSENTNSITVKLLSPRLILPQPDKKGVLKAPKAIQVSETVVAEWEGAGESEVDLRTLGSEGKFRWTCSIRPQEVVNLLIAWEVNSPIGITVAGLQDGDGGL